MKSPVLIIDDDVDFVTLLKKSLLASNIELLTAHTGAEGLKILRKSNPIMILLDQMLPDVKGEDLLSFIRSIKNDIPVILLTGLNDIPLVVRAIRNGANDYMQKPVEYDEILNRIQKIHQEAQKASATTTTRFSLRQQEYRRLVAALESTAGNITHAAKILGVGRDTIYRRLKKFHITPKKLDAQPQK